MKPVIIKILKVMGFIFLAVMSGSYGYAKIEDYDFLDAVYMTVITLTTTGFGEVRPLSADGKIFTMFLLLTGMGVVTYSLSAIASYIASIDFSKRRRDKMEKRVKNFEGHTIVCGYGRMGEIICKKLEDEGVNFVVIERRESLIQMLKNTPYHYIEGNAAHDDILEKAAIKSAKVLVSVIDNDGDGLYIALAGRSYNPDIEIIVRANEPSAKQRMIRAGANRVVLPFVMSGLQVAESVINPAVEDFLNIRGVTGETAEMIQLADLYVTKESHLVGRAIREIGPDIEKLIIVGIRKKNKEFVFSPRGSYTFEEGDCLIALGDQAAYKMTKKKYRLSSLAPGVDSQQIAA